MKRRMIDITGAVKPVNNSIRVYILGLESLHYWEENAKCLIANDGLEIKVAHSDELPLEILFVNDAENSAWISELDIVGDNYDIREALSEFCIEYEKDIFSAANGVYFHYSPYGEADYTEQSVLIKSNGCGTYFFGDSAYDNNSDIHITKYISYEANNNKHVRKAFTKLFKGKAFSNDDFCQLLLNRRKCRSLGYEEYDYTKCTLYTNKFIYDCRNGDIVITVNDKKYLITSNDMFLNELYVVRLLTAASAGNLEEVIIDKYPSVLVHMQKEKIAKNKS